ncbi:hypothetical protein NUH87_29345 [Pseudomonas batumici]|uniref:hypothetical protein n=1 Tax=Pseudomonas batumici TaxID=226910 RepID=UPI0030D033EF
MKPISIHHYFHDVFGQEQTVFELLAILLFGTGLTVALAVSSTQLIEALPLWRSVLALVLILDIAAGCIANFTRSTNDFYAQRPANRWGFIAVHVHVVAVAFLLGRETDVAWAVWAYTLASATIVNLLKPSSYQPFAGAFLLVTGLGWMPLWPGISPLMVVVCALFMLKVIYGFAVDHYGGVRMRSSQVASHD